jgi:pyrroloquinoline quinone biosynthesis protein E
MTTRTQNGSNELVEGPFGVLAELTHACPLACAYCSNPLELTTRAEELDTDEWRRVLTQAADLGALQCHFSGGEPLLRRDLVELVATATELGLYSNLVTSAVGFTQAKAHALHEAGLDHVQISIQADEPVLSDRLAGIASFDRKVEAARLVKALDWPLTLNVVLHRHNLDRVAAILARVEELGADRVELANTQYYGWALHNRSALLPSRDQLRRAEPVVREARERLRGHTEVLWILPDYYEQYPKPCMSGWGARQLVIGPDGNAWPCLAAHELPLPPANVREHDLAWIWRASPLFEAFRGTEWMSDPCRSCERREIDRGGCRCQAHALTGDPARTDPVCHLAPDRQLIDNALRRANSETLHSHRSVPVTVRPHRA